MFNFEIKPTRLTEIKPIRTPRCLKLMHRKRRYHNRLYCQAWPNLPLAPPRLN
jgi:hypothetical protein